MSLIIMSVISICLVGIIGAYFVNLRLKRFQDKLRIHINEMEDIKNRHPQGKLYPDIIREDYSLSYVGRNTFYFTIIIFITSIIEAFFYHVSKSYLTSFSYFIIILAFLMVLRLPLLIELFVRNNRYNKINILKKERRSDIFYHVYIFRIRPFIIIVAIIPLLVAFVV